MRNVSVPTIFGISVLAITLVTVVAWVIAKLLFSISKRLLVAEVELIQPSFKFGHQLVDTRLDTLPALLQEEIRIAAEEQLKITQLRLKGL